MRCIYRLFGIKPLHPLHVVASLRNHLLHWNLTHHNLGSTTYLIVHSLSFVGIRSLNIDVVCIDAAPFDPYFLSKRSGDEIAVLIVWVDKSWTSSYNVPLKSLTTSTTVNCFLWNIIAKMLWNCGQPTNPAKYDVDFAQTQAAISKVAVEAFLKRLKMKLGQSEI